MKNFIEMQKVSWTYMLCECVVCELTSWVEFIMFVFRRSRDRRDRPSRGGPTARVLKRPNRPEPVMGPRPSAVFFSSFFPPAYYLGSLDGYDYTVRLA
jgi:hypothetical protein